MKNSELVQLYVLFNKFTEEYVKEDDVNYSHLKKWELPLNSSPD